MAKTPKLIPCPACKKQLSATAPTCPHCGHVPTDDERAKSKKSAKWTQAIGAILGLALIFPVLLSVHDCDRAVEDWAKTDDPPAKLESEHKVELRLVNWEWHRTEYGSLYLRGTVQNESYYPLSYAEVSFRLYDKAKNQVGTAMTNITDLGSHAAWKFEAPVMEDNVHSAEPIGVSGHY